MSAVNVVAIITAKAGKRAEVLTAFKANAPAVHAKSEHMKAYGAKTKDWLESRVIHVLTPA